jgi:sulfite oxidase
VRAIVPGTVGVRNVKWLQAVTTSDEESHGPWQRGIAYKGFSPNVRSFDGLEVDKVPSVQEQPVMSAITAPTPSDVVEGDTVDVRGFAWSGGGRGIVRVDLSADDGRTWHTATLKEGSEQKLSRAWAWTFYEAELPVPPGVKAGAELTIVAKATDASYNTQPESPEAIWNVRGINFNAWPRVTVKVDR